jgi:hypothetical protein
VTEEAEPLGTPPGKEVHDGADVGKVAARGLVAPALELVEALAVVADATAREVERDRRETG